MPSASRPPPTATRRCHRELEPFAFSAERREEDARKSRCPVCEYLLPSNHDVLADLETRRVHAAVLAARACPEHQDGCRLRPLSQRRQPPRGISRGADRKSVV